MTSLSEKQLRMVAEAEKEQEAERRKAALLAKAEEEKRLRKKVFVAIMLLSEKTMDLEGLMKVLPCLDAHSWAECVEERRLAGQCGLPLCPRPVTEHKKQKYHIDRRARKIYEVCGERGKFCCSECHSASGQIRAQLADEPLWLRGDKTTVPVSLPPLPAHLSDGTVQSAPTLPLVRPLCTDVRRHPSTRTQTVEIVADTLVASLHDLKIADHAASSAEDEETEAGEKVEETRPLDADDECFVESVKRFVTQQKTCGDVSSVTAAVSKLGVSPKTKTSEKASSESDAERLARVRAKLTPRGRGRGVGGEKMKKGPLLIEPLPITPSALRATRKAEKIGNGRMEGDEMLGRVGVDEERTGGGREEGEEEKEKEQGDSREDEAMRRAGTVVSGWLTRRTVELIRMGGRQPGTETDRMMAKWMRGEMLEEKLEESLSLPCVDHINVRSRQTQILVEGLKPSWVELERHLNESSYAEHLLHLAGSLQPPPHQLAGWSKRDARAVVRVLWRCMCAMREDELSHHFASVADGKRVGEAMRRSLEQCGFSVDVYVEAVGQVEKRLLQLEKEPEQKSV